MLISRDSFSVFPRITMAIFNSVLSALMEDEINHGVNDRTVLLLQNHSLTYSVLALSFDTAMYLLINDQFNILSYLFIFGVSVFDIQRILERYKTKLNQQSSFLVNGDVRVHFNKVLLSHFSQPDLGEHRRLRYLECRQRCLEVCGAASKEGDVFFRVEDSSRNGGPCAPPALHRASPAERAYERTLHR